MSRERSTRETSIRETSVVARAPGKLFLTGDYAVLAGAPALIAAVDRHARVRLVLGDARGPLVVDSLAEGQHETLTEVERGDVPEGDVGCVIAAMRAAGAGRPGFCGRAGSVTVDSRPFVDGVRKLGLGRSAATLAAAVGAFLAAGGDGDREQLLAVAVSANVIFQEGLGSGGDVAAAVCGGVVEVSRRAGDLHVVPRRLPDGLRLVAGWTGESASTVPLLRRFSAAQQAEPPVALTELCRVAVNAVDAIARGDADALCESVDCAGDVLERLGVEVGLPIVTPALGRLMRAARGVGAAAKPSGAGGGDCGIALARSAAEAAAVEDAWRDAGITPLTLAIAPEGVTVG